MEKARHDTWVLMARTLGGEATEAEMLKLQSILAEDMELTQQYELLTRLWQQENIDQSETNVKFPDNEVQRIIKLAGEQLDNEVKGAETPRKRFITRQFIIGSISIAASVILAFACYKLLHTNSRSVPEVVSQVLAAGNGSRSRNILADGSVVWLNAGSKLILDPGFKKSNRIVFLEGEGYFEVVKNPFPFIVCASGINIKVVGTAFNVKSYPSEKTIEATLFHGSIKLSRQGDTAHEIVLKPHEKFIIERRNIKFVEKGKALAELKGTVQVLENKPDSQLTEKAWVYNRLVFRGDNFETLAANLDRWYDVKIIFTDDNVKQLRFNGSFESETIEQALNALQLASSFSYKINDHEILIGSY